MNISVLYVGLDYHQKAVQVCVLDSKGKVLKNGPVSNDWRQIQDFVGTDATVHAAIETCGGAADLTEELIDNCGWSMNMAHAHSVSRIKQNPDKTDFSDARLLADLERVGYVPRVWQAPKEVRGLRHLVRHRHQLVGQRRNTKLRISALLRENRVGQPEANRWTKRWIEWVKNEADLPEGDLWIINKNLEALKRIKEEIAEVEAYLEENYGEDKIVKKLMTKKGIGLVTACVFRAEIGRFDRFRKGKQLSRFCGATPCNVSSGDRQSDSGLVDRCNRLLRSTLMELAHRLIRWDPTYRDMAMKMIKRGKPKCVVVAAVANRWTRKLYHEMKPLGLAA